MEREIWGLEEVETNIFHAKSLVGYISDGTLGARGAKFSCLVI